MSAAYEPMEASVSGLDHDMLFVGGVSGVSSQDCDDTCASFSGVLQSPVFSWSEGRPGVFQALCFGPSSTPEMVTPVMLLCPISSSCQACSFALSGRLADVCVISRGILLDKGQVLSPCRDLGLVISFVNLV